MFDPSNHLIQRQLVNDLVTLPTSNTVPVIPIIRSHPLTPVTDSTVTHATSLISDLVTLLTALRSISEPDGSLAQQADPMTPDGGKELESHHNAALPARLTRPVGTRPLSKHFGAPSAPSKRLAALRKIQDSKGSRAKPASSAKVAGMPSENGIILQPYVEVNHFFVRYDRRFRPSAWPLKKITKSNAPKFLLP